MKKLISLFVAAVFLIPALGSGFESLKKTTKIEKDEHGGYSDTQRDYHERMSKQSQSKKKGAYYDHGYHIKSQEFKANDEQFIKSAGAEKSSKKKSKKKSSK